MPASLREAVSVGTARLLASEVARLGSVGALEEQSPTCSFYLPETTPRPAILWSWSVNLAPTGKGRCISGG